MTTVYVSIDMEGVAGVATRDSLVPGRHLYEEGRRLMTLEANAAALGAFDAGATRVLVNDSHGTMCNLVLDLLDDRVETVLGTPKRWAMVEQVDAGFDVALFVGYHAGPDSTDGVLAHTYSGAAFSDVRLNGRSLSELQLNALVAGQAGVPVGLVTGDEQTCAAAAGLLPGAVTVAVNQGLGLSAARSVSPGAARDLIRAGAARAVAGRAALSPLATPPALVLEAALRPPGAAEYAVAVPGTERVDAWTVRRDCAGPAEVLDVLQTWSRLVAAYLAA